jgi:hypothetical protein
MMKYTSIHALLAAALLCSTFTACGDDGSDTTSQTTTTNPTATTTDPTTTSPTTGTTTDPTADPTTDPTPGTTTTNTTSTTDPDTTGTTGDDPGFVFPQDPFDAYTQIDRHGAVEAGTAGIAASAGLGFTPGQDVTIRDAYNASNPVEDAASKWVPEIAKSVMFFHAALDDDLMGLKLVPASFDETIAQAGPVIIPDAIKYDPSKPTAYPNGRKLTDPVVDITLAAVLLKLGGNQPLSLLADLPLNPPANDVPFGAEFPYLAPPHL